MDFARFVAVGSEQVKNDGCARVLRTGGVIGALRCGMSNLAWAMVRLYTVIETRGCMHQYNNHPIYGIAVRGPGKEWYRRGLIFEPEDKVTEIKRLDCTELTFSTKKKAEEHALKLCKKWIDDQRGAIESTTLAHSAPLKAGAIAI